MSYYTIRIDGRGREVLINAVSAVKTAAEQPLIRGQHTEEILQKYEELLQLHRGLLYVAADPEEEEPKVDVPN